MPKPLLKSLLNEAFTSRIRAGNCNYALVFVSLIGFQCFLVRPTGTFMVFEQPKDEPV
jgi:hypothetical protein